MRHKAPYPSPSNLPSEKPGPAVLGLCSREQEAGGDQPQCGERASGVSAVPGSGHLAGQVSGQVDTL